METATTSVPPEISVVVPTRSRPRALGTLLRRLAHQTFPARRFEVIVVDDCGDPPAAPVVDRFRHSLSTTLIRLGEAAGCAGARQAGAEGARGRLLVFTDDDCLPGEDWLEALWLTGMEYPAAGIAGPVVNGRPKSLLAESLQLVVDCFTEHENDRAERVFNPTNNLALPRALYRAIGGLDADWPVGGGEDRDLCHRWIAAGYRLAWAPRARVEHRPILGLWAYARKFFSYGRGAVIYLRKHESGRRSLATTIRHSLSLPLAPFRSFPPARAWRVSLLVQLSQVCTAAGVLYQVARGGRDDPGGNGREPLAADPAGHPGPVRRVATELMAADR